MKKLIYKKRFTENNNIYDNNERPTWSEMKVEANTFQNKLYITILTNTYEQYRNRIWETETLADLFDRISAARLMLIERRTTLRCKM